MAFYEGLLNMQLAGFDVDEKADGSGMAPTSWISKELMKTPQIWNKKLEEESSTVVLWDKPGWVEDSENSGYKTNLTESEYGGEVAVYNYTTSSSGTLIISYKTVKMQFGVVFRRVRTSEGR